MAEEMIFESAPWESDEAEDWEADEAIVDSDDSVEDFGERARRRVQQRRRPFPATSGVGGLAIRGPDGRVRNVPFPAKLATAAETNRGLARQEVARRTLEGRLSRLETRSGGQQKAGSSVSGLVSLMIGGGLTAYGAIGAAKQSGGSRLGNWASENSTKTAAVISASQIATSGAKFLINGRYHGSGIGMAADIFSAAQLALVAFGSFYKPEDYTPIDTIDNARKLVDDAPKGTLFLLGDGTVWRVEVNSAGKHMLRLIR